MCIYAGRIYTYIQTYVCVNKDSALMLYICIITHSTLYCMYICTYVGTNIMCMVIYLRNYKLLIFYNIFILLLYTSYVSSLEV